MFFHVDDGRPVKMKIRFNMFRSSAHLPELAIVHLSGPFIFQTITFLSRWSLANQSGWKSHLNDVEWNLNFSESTTENDENTKFSFTKCNIICITYAACHKNIEGGWK